MSDVKRSVSATAKPQGEARFLKGVAVIGICLIFGATGLLDGCVCFHPSVKQVPDTRPGKEGQKVEVREELPWHCKVFQGTIAVLSWFLPGDRSTPEEKRAKLLHEMNRQYLDVRRQQKPR